MVFCILSTHSAYNLMCSIILLVYRGRTDRVIAITLPEFNYFSQRLILSGGKVENIITLNIIVTNNINLLLKLSQRLRVSEYRINYTRKTSAVPFM